MISSQRSKGLHSYLDSRNNPDFLTLLLSDSLTLAASWILLEPSHALGEGILLRVVAQ